MNSFYKKKILFIAPKFYNYHQLIVSQLESNGASVTFFAEDIYSVIYRISQKAFPFIAKQIRRNYTKTIVNHVKENSYDIVFVIRGGILSPDTLVIMKEELPKAKFVMYQWDSNEQSKYLPIAKYFDRVKTFDRNDAQQFNIPYLPLFYADKYHNLSDSASEKKYDLVFFGAYHSDRLEVIKHIHQLFAEHGLKFKYHLYITKLALSRLLLTGVIKLQDLKFLKTYTVGTDLIIKSYKETQAVLDIELNIQSGLTMRTFETLGANLKLVTTNFNIENESFFDPDRIMIIDRNNIKIDLSFFRTKLKVDNQFSAFRIQAWLINVLE